jgi:CDGSH-type Zn-finger protein/ferredoxin
MMKSKISAVGNGPLVLECAEDSLRQDGKPVEKSNPAYLCRCGRSENKPFCDGTHSKTGFQSKREIDREILQVYEGKEITINFNRSICSGAALCVRALPSVFQSEGSEDWIHPDRDETAKIIKVVNACPSGALSYSMDGKTTIDSRENPRVTIVKDGPYKVEGTHLEQTPAPTNASATKYSLCRCGHSRNKPFCDYSHAEKHWKDGDGA